MNSIITLAQGDYDLARKWYNVKGEYFHGVYVNPITLEHLKDLDETPTSIKSTCNILLGNSANSSNNHIDGLRLLKKFNNEKIKIFVPLSYGAMRSTLIK